MSVSAVQEEGWNEFQREWKKREDIKAAREGSHQPKEFRVYHGGPLPVPKMGAAGSHGWNVGDIDFDPDGSIFIRNPYLANAIEVRLQENYQKWNEWAEKKALGTLPKDAKEPVLFRLTRDEGWSGGTQNMVC